MERTKAQNARFHLLLGQRKFDAQDKAELVRMVTGGRTGSSAEMTVAEMQLAIERLADAQVGSIKKMRAKIINIARDIFGLADGDVWGQGHYDRLNVFLVDKFKVPLHRLPYEQLRNAVTAMEAWRDWARLKAAKEALKTGV